jgi:hypothetical protein
VILFFPALNIFNVEAYLSSFQISCHLQPMIIPWIEAIIDRKFSKKITACRGFVSEHKNAQVLSAAFGEIL